MAEHPVAYANARLWFDTKLELRNIFELPLSEHYFRSGRLRRMGKSPDLKGCTRA